MLLLWNYHSLFTTQTYFQSGLSLIFSFRQQISERFTNIFRESFEKNETHIRVLY